MIPESNLYNPANQSKEFLIEHFIAHTKEFKSIREDVLKNKMKYPPQHYIIQGQRGMGKTTLLLRIKYEIENTPELNKWLIPVFFNEETYDVTSLSDLWEKLLKHVDAIWKTNYIAETETLAEQPDYEKKCFELLIKILQERKQKLLLLYDNFGELFLDILNEKETHRLREILTTCADIRIIGASAVVLEGLHDYSKPFYEFFKIVYLEGLSKDETFELIKKLQEKSKTPLNLEKNKAKIETLAILTGGVIRTVMLIYEVILSDHDGSALKDLNSILDIATPLYKHRIEVLPPQQRKIVDAIAKNWDAISISDLSKTLRVDGKPMQSKLISAQLNQLDKNNFIDIKGTTTKNKLYQLKERFFNIWYLMRHGDANDKCRVKWFTRYLELFYGDSGLKDFVTEHIKKLESGSFKPDMALFVADAIANSSLIDSSTLKLLYKATEKILPEEQRKTRQASLVKNVETLIYQLIEKIDESKADNIDKLFEAVNELPGDIEGLADVKAYLLSSIGDKYLDFDNLEMAKKCWELALSIDKNDINALVGLGLLYTLNSIDISKGKDYLLKYINFVQKNKPDDFIKKIISAKFALALNYFKSKMKKNKAYEIILNIKAEANEDKNIIYSFGQYYLVECLILIWNNEYEKANNVLLNFFSKTDFVIEETFSYAFTDILKLFIAKKQYHTALKLFEMEELKLKDRFKPIYYALMTYMKEEYPDEVSKMGSELEEPVKDVIKEIEQMAVDYV